MAGFGRYLVENYAPARRAPEIEAAVARVADGVSGMRQVRTTFLPADEMCLHFVEAPSLEAVRDALQGAGISSDRITEAAEWSRVNKPALSPPEREREGRPWTQSGRIQA